MKHGTWIVLVAAMAVVPCAQSAQTLVNERTLSVDAALEIATAALANCRPHGVPVTITVLDHAARVKVVLRDDGANLHSSDHSLRKAYTALTYGMPSGEYGNRAAANPASAGPLHLPNITTAAGGLPIRAGNTIVGAIGISGTPGDKGGGSADEGCARAGIEKVAKALGG
jgi:uncharacterized protein GlcG (DUF336 family)